MQFSRNFEHIATIKPLGFSYHGYLNRLDFNILNRAEPLSCSRNITKRINENNLKQKLKVEVEV